MVCASIGSSPEQGQHAAHFALGQLAFTVNSRSASDCFETSVSCQPDLPKCTAKRGSHTSSYCRKPGVRISDKGSRSTDIDSFEERAATSSTIAYLNKNLGGRPCHQNPLTAP